MAEWRFPSNDDGEIKGLNDTGVAMFRGTPLRSLAREICQNSLDAARNETVIVEFSEFVISPSKLPGCKELTNAFERCAEYWKMQKSNITRSFYANAVDKISADKIHILRISDFNTSGLTGSRGTVNTDWVNLTKSQGVSDKKGPAGGSYGIGKFAPFACSDFSTVYYSTCDENGLCASQGVARLVSFCRADDQTTQGVGYYGEEKNTPVFCQMMLDPKFSRDEDTHGTDIYIAGYNQTTNNEDWEDSIIVSVLDSFLASIWQNKLVVNIGEKKIDRDSLDYWIENYREQLTDYTEQYYKVFTSSETKWYEEDFNGMGSVKLGLLLGDQKMCRRVAMIRQTGMKIKDKNRLPNFIPFAGVMLINGDDINEKLRCLENPEHTEWQTARADDEQEAKRLLKAINDYIKQKISELAADGGRECFDAAGLGELIPDEPDKSIDEAKEEAVKDDTVEIIMTKPDKKKQADNFDKGSNEDKADDFRNGGFKEGNTVLGYIHNEEGEHINPSEGRGPYPVDVDENAKGQIPEHKNVTPQKLRVICTDKALGKYDVSFVPNTDGTKGYISLDLSAEEGRYPAPLIFASISGQGSISVEENKITGVAFQKGMSIKASIQLEYSDYCTLEVRAGAY